MAGEFQKLGDFKWRGVSYPILRITTTVAHDLVEHKFWQVDGATLEPTGLQPVRISVNIPLSNHIVPGQHERWSSGALFPNALRTFMRDFSDKSEGVLEHPELGVMRCMPDRMEFVFSGEQQGYTEVSASFVENTAIFMNFPFDRDNPEPLAELNQAQFTLNASGVDLKKRYKDITTFPKFIDDIESLGRKLRAFTDTPSVLAYRVVGVANRILYQAHSLEESLDRLVSLELAQVSPLRPFTSRFTQPQDGNLVSRVKDALQRIQASTYAIRNRGVQQSATALFTVPEDMSVAGVLASVPVRTTFSSLLQLNPGLARSPIVSKGTLVRYAYLARGERGNLNIPEASTTRFT